MCLQKKAAVLRNVKIRQKIENTWLYIVLISNIEHCRKPITRSATAQNSNKQYREKNPVRAKQKARHEKFQNTVQPKRDKTINNTATARDYELSHTLKNIKYRIQQNQRQNTSRPNTTAYSPQQPTRTNFWWALRRRDSLMFIDFIIALVILYYGIPLFLKMLIHPKILPFLLAIILGLLFISFLENKDTPNKK